MSQIVSKAVGLVDKLRAHQFALGVFFRRQGTLFRDVTSQEQETADSGDQISHNNMKTGCAASRNANQQKCAVRHAM